MRITRRDFTALTLSTAAIAATRPAFASEGVIRSHGASLTAELKYGPDFKHFDYANPNAPKGGIARLGTQGSFDSFNPFIVKGDTPTGIGIIFDTLMGRSLDQGSTEYGLLAEWIEYPEDFSWASFRLRDGAAWHDGVPITVEDVIFSINILIENTSRGIQSYFFKLIDDPFFNFIGEFCQLNIFFNTFREYINFITRQMSGKSNIKSTFSNCLRNFFRFKNYFGSLFLIIEGY